MNLLGTITRHPDVPAQGRTCYRTAARAIILDGCRLLMVYSAVNGDYKFPGGRVEGQEGHAAALAREIREECGREALHIGPAFGQVIEYDLPEEPNFEIFQMTSCYYFCRVAAAQQPQRLDAYEAALGFQPVWIDIDEAIQANEAVLWSEREDKPFWTRRETLVLGLIRQRIHSPGGVA